MIKTVATLAAERIDGLNREMNEARAELAFAIECGNRVAYAAMVEDGMSGGNVWILRDHANGDGTYRDVEEDVVFPPAPVPRPYVLPRGGFIAHEISNLPNTTKCRRKITTSWYRLSVEQVRISPYVAMICDLCRKSNAPLTERRTEYSRLGAHGL